METGFLFEFALSNTSKPIHRDAPIDSGTLNITLFTPSSYHRRASQTLTKMSNNEKTMSSRARSHNESNVEATSPVVTEERLPRRGNAGIEPGIRNEKSTWWLQFLASATLTAFLMFLYDKFVGLPRRSCPPCEARGY